MESEDTYDSLADADKLEKGQGKGNGEATSKEGEKPTSRQAAQEPTTKQCAQAPTSNQGAPELTSSQRAPEPTSNQGAPEPTSNQGAPEPTINQGAPEPSSKQGATSKQGGRSQNVDQGERGIQIRISETGGLLKRVQNLRWIKGNEHCSEALRDWKYQKKSLGGKLDRKEKRVEELTHQVYNLVGFFSVFQGVILTAVSQLEQSAQSTPVGCPSRPPLCKKVWFPIALSLLAALAAVTGIGLKFRHIYEVDITVRTYRHELRVAEDREATLVRYGDKIDLESLEAKGSNGNLETGQWLLKAFAVIGAVIVFTVILILSYLTILCDKFV